MIRHRLSWVLIFLAATIVLQALGSSLALGEAQQQIVRGRIASDIHRGFVEFSATKQRLHTWVAQMTLHGGGDRVERDRLIDQIRQILTRLQRLSQEAQAQQLAVQHPQEQQQRDEALAKLEQSIQVLQAAVYQARPAPADLPTTAAWDSLSQLFEYAGGNDLRQLIAQSIARESAVVARERAAADRALQDVRWIWLGVSAMLALLALMATIYFGRALRRPLQALAEGAQALAQGKRKHRIATGGNDEFSAVAASMNSMAEQLEQHHHNEVAARAQLEELVKARTAQLHDANESLRQTDVRRRQLLADISHELRTPTTAIRGEAEVTLRSRSRSDADYRDALERIVQTSRELGSVIDDLLSIARADLETLSLLREPIDLTLALTDAWNQASALAATRDIKLVGAPDQAGVCKLMGDRQRLRQLLLILLDNAIFYSHAGSVVKLTVERMESSQFPQGAWRIAICDEGIGISEQELPLVFERHFRGQQARAHRACGSGLGLPIALSLAHAHGGQLTITSQIGKGTVVELLLPSLARIFHQDSARRAQNRDGWVRDATNRGRVPSERSSVQPDTRVWDAAGAEGFCSAPVGFDTQQRSRADDNAQNDAPGEICGLAAADGALTLEAAAS